MTQKINKLSKLASFVCALLLINGVTWLVTSANQKNGVYPVNADSIGIPIVLTIDYSILLLPILIAISLLPNKGLLNWLKTKSIVHRVAVKLGLLLFYGPAFILAVFGLAYWSLPNHYSIAASYFAFFVLLLMGLFFAWREIGKIR